MVVNVDNKSFCITKMPIYLCPFTTDWSKMLGQSPSTTPQPQPAAARDNSGKLGKEVKTEDKDALKFSAENLSSDWLVSW